LEVSIGQPLLHVNGNIAVVYFHKIQCVVPMFVVVLELCLLQIEVLYFIDADNLLTTGRSAYWLHLLLFSSR